MNYKDTLFLPKTDFPMKADLVQREPARLAKWEAANLYEQIQAARADAELFVLHDGPPFANGDVHMGTALNKVLKDIIVKSRTMLGFRAPFVPGWDCHGLPIEFKVVKESRGLAPAEVRRRSEEYACKYIEIQRGQFKRLGVLGTWADPYLTLAPSYEAEIIRAFGTFVEQGLVYQSKKPVYWSTGAQTALAEAEIEYADREDPAIYVKFVVPPEEAAKAQLPTDLPLSLVIWTTTPWTLPANVAIAVHPKFEYVLVSTGTERFIVAQALLEAFATAAGLSLQPEGPLRRGQDLLGIQAQHPFLPRTSLVVPAEYVTTETGTGLVHTAPGHGADDYLTGLAQKLPILSPVDDRGRYTEDVGVPEWVGEYVFDANAKVVERLRANHALVAEQKYLHSYPHCWRSKTPIVFRAVEQFFINVDKLRGPALEAIRSVQWIPAWGENRITGTVEFRPDWCISRQRTWGVPLPVFYTPEGAPILDAAIARQVAEIVEQGGTNLWFEHDDAWWSQRLDLPAGTTRRNDTLDVWMDSGVSHAAVVSKRPELQPTTGARGFRPADVYIEATDQHRGWFQSSLMTSVSLHAGQAPYKTVITHGFVVDKDTRKKVSKSAQGTYAKPMDAQHFVQKYGADVVRLWASSVEFTNEVPFSEESFAGLADAYRQFRNVLRILLANFGDAPAADHLDGATTVDRWMLSRLQEVTATCRTAYEAYDFRRVFQTLNQFVTVEVSAFYVDITKDRLYCDALTSPRRQATQAVMRQVFEALAKLLAPILAFTADEAWEHAGHLRSIHLEEFPQGNAVAVNPAAETTVGEWLKLRAVIAQAVEAARQAGTIGKSLEATVTLEIADPALLAQAQAQVAELEEAFILSELQLQPGTALGARVAKNPHRRCARCWRHKPSVNEAELCDRCAEVIAARA